jgi:hypothetical protein
MSTMTSVMFLADVHIRKLFSGIFWRANRVCEVWARAAGNAMTLLLATIHMQFLRLLQLVVILRSPMFQCSEPLIVPSVVGDVSEVGVVGGRPRGPADV